MPLQPGDQLGPYEILAPIGAGGMGEVYRARDTRLKRDAALKVLPEAFARDPGRMARFQREAEVLASLNHPNIAHIYGLEERALVMEFVEGESPRGPMSFEDAWKIMTQVAAGLEYAHERRVVHRDLKPSNLKVTPEGRVKILDFGLAKALSSTSDRAPADSDSPTISMGMTQAGVILGTAAYMAPEQIKGKEADRRADIWAFGIVLYELLTGERPFQGSDSTEIMARAVTSEPVLDKAPAKVRRLLNECLKKDPEDRLRWIGDVARFLDDPTASIPAPPARPGARLGLALAALFALTTAVFLWLWLRPTPRPPAPVIRIATSLPFPLTPSAAPIAVSRDGTTT
jgi:serine/threonine protein kinase